MSRNRGQRNGCDPSAGVRAVRRGSGKAGNARFAPTGVHVGEGPLQFGDDSAGEDVLDLHCRPGHLILYGQKT